MNSTVMNENDVSTEYEIKHDAETIKEIYNLNNSTVDATNKSTTITLNNRHDRRRLNAILRKKRK